MMEKFLFLDDKGDPIPRLAYSESSWSGTGHYGSIDGFATVMGFAAILVDYLGLDKEEQDRLLQNIRSVREEYSGAVATREQIIEAVKANPGGHFSNLGNLFRALPELDDLKQELRQEMGEKWYLGLIRKEPPPPPSPQPM